MSNNPTHNTHLPSFFSQYYEIFCLPFIPTSKDSEKELLNKILFFLRQAGCGYWTVNGSYQTPAGDRQDCVFLFTRNERALQGFDYFRYLFFSLAWLLQLPFFIVKFPDNSINVISCGDSSGYPAGLQRKIPIDDLEDTAKIISGCTGMKCALVDMRSEANSMQGMNGAMMRDGISRMLFSRGEEGLYNRLELEPDAIPDPEPFIYTKEQEPVVEVIQQCEVGDWPTSPETFFVAKHPMYILTAYRDGRTIIDNVHRQTMLVNFVHQAGFAIVKGTKPDSEKEYIVIQNFLNFADDSQLLKLLNMTAETLDLTEPIKEITFATDELFEGTAMWVPVAGLRGACYRDKIREVEKYYPENLLNNIESITDLLNKATYKTLNNLEPEGSPAYEVIDFLNKPHRAFCLQLLDKPLSAPENIKIEKALKRILESGDFTGFILNKLERENKSYPAWLFATQESLSDNSFLQLLISLCKSYGQKAGLYKSPDGHFFRIPVDLNKQIELVGETPMASEEEIGDLLNTATIGDFKLYDKFTLTSFEPVKGFSAVERRAKILKVMDEYGENGIAKLLGQDVEPAPFSKPIVENTQSKEKKVPDEPYFTIG